MDKSPSAQSNPRSSPPTPILVLALALLITATATLFAAKSIDAKDNERFRHAVLTTSDIVTNRLESYEELLRGVRGLFIATDPVNAWSLHQYVRSLELRRDFPGVQAVGFSRRFAGGGPASLRQQVALLEPRSVRGPCAFGADMSLHPVLREAMERARDTGALAMSSHITLAQDDHPNGLMGCLLYLPIYRQGALVGTLAQRRAALYGFVFVSVRADGLLDGLFGQQEAPRVTLEFFDGRGRVADRKLYDTPPQLDALGTAQPRFKRDLVITFGGREWTLGFEPSRHFERSSSKGFVPTIGMGGLIISLLLFALTTAQTRRRNEAERISREVQRSEEALRQANQAKDEFLAMLGHELRNPLGAISNALQVMAERPISDPHLIRSRDVVERQVRHQTRLIEDLLDVSRVYSGKISLRREIVDLNEIVLNAAEGLKWAVEEQEHSLVRHLAKDPVLVHGDPVRLEQIVTNLIHNAIKYTPPGGRVDVTVLQTGDEAVVRVCDTGVGISPEMLGQIFNVFTQAQISIDRSQGGLGLGLTLVRNLTQMHGGRVEAMSPGVGKGSEFILRFPPVSPDAVAAMPSLKQPAAVVPGPVAEDAVRPALRVLIVEDLQDARETLQELLELLGHEVETAADGRSGLTKLLAIRPDVALIDIGLPILDGYELATRFRAQAPEARVRLVALTGYGQPEDRIRAHEAGFEAHVVKPIDPESLKRLLLDNSST